jgi:hypothetical protein
MHSKYSYSEVSHSRYRKKAGELEIQAAILFLFFLLLSIVFFYQYKKLARKK